jgi:hypothetical protein
MALLWTPTTHWFSAWIETFRKVEVDLQQFQPFTTNHYQYRPWWSSYWADVEIWCMQELHSENVHKKFYLIRMHLQILIFNTSGPGMQHLHCWCIRLVQKQSMGMKYADEYSQTQPCQGLAELSPSGHQQDPVQVCQKLSSSGLNVKLIRYQFWCTRCTFRLKWDS